MTRAETFFISLYDEGLRTLVDDDSSKPVITGIDFTPPGDLVCVRQMLEDTDCIILAGYASDRSDHRQKPNRLEIVDISRFSDQITHFLDMSANSCRPEVSYLQYGQGNILIVLTTASKRVLFNLNRRVGVYEYQAQNCSGLGWENVDLELPDSGRCDMQLLTRFGREVSLTSIQRPSSS